MSAHARTLLVLSSTSDLVSWGWARDYIRLYIDIGMIILKLYLGKGFIIIQIKNYQKRYILLIIQVLYCVFGQTLLRPVIDPI